MRNQRQVVLALAMIIVGVTLLIASLLDLEVWVFCFPTALILLGLWLLFRPSWIGDVLAGVGLFGPTVTGSGNVVAQERDLSGFTKVDVSHAFKVKIRQSEQFRVVVHVDDNIVEYLEVTTRGDTLRIGLGRGVRVRRATLEAEVTMPVLTGLGLSGVSQVTIADFASEEPFNARLSGASSLRGDIQAGGVRFALSGSSSLNANVHAKDARFDLSGSSQATVTGSAEEVRIDSSGSSGIDLSEFPVTNARVLVSGSSKATANPSGRLDVDASGSSRVYYLGNPALGNIATSGGSSLEHKKGSRKCEQGAETPAYGREK